MKGGQKNWKLGGKKMKGDQKNWGQGRKKIEGQRNVTLEDTCASESRHLP